LGVKHSGSRDDYRAVVPKVGGTAPLGAVRNSKGGGEAEMGG